MRIKPNKFIKMKKYLFALLFVFGTTYFVQAQTELDILRKLFQVEKKAALADFLQLTDAQNTAFWPMYAEYEEQRAILGQKRIQLIEDYARNYTSMSPEKADELVKQSLSLTKQRAKLRQKYYKKTKKLLGSVKAAAFLQFENYVDNAVSLEISNQIPFIGEY